MNVQEPYYSFIVKGKKKIEVRLNKGKFSSLEKGDIIKMGDQGIELLVLDIKKYKTFRAIFENEKMEDIIPDKDCADDAIAVCYRFFTKEQEKEFGVVAIKIQKQ